MKKIVLATAVILATSSICLAQTTKPDDSSLGTKAMKDQPGTSSGGSTANPTAKPADSSISDKAMKDQPGTMGGSTDMPTAKPADSSISDKAMKDAPGTK